MKVGIFPNLYNYFFFMKDLSSDPPSKNLYLGQNISEEAEREIEFYIKNKETRRCFG